MRKFYKSCLTMVLALVAMIANAQVSTVYSWDGNGLTSADNLAVSGGAATPMGGDANVVAGAKQKNNWCFKLGKGYMVEGVATHYVEIALDQALKGGEEISFNAFMTSEGKNATFGIGFDEVAEVSYEVEEVITSNGVPTIEGKLTVPAEAAGCSKIRLYRKAGNTTVYVSKLTITGAAGAPAAATIENLSLTVADGEQIDEDGDFKVTLNYSVAFNDPTLEENSYMVSAVAKYIVTDADGNVVDDYKTTPSVSATSKNIYVSGLEGGKEYTMQIQNFYLIDRTNADYETNWGDTIVALENCAEVKFVPVAAVAKPVEVKGMSVSNDKNSLIDEEGDYTVTFNYTGKINDENLSANDLYSFIKYQVYDENYEFITSGNRDFSLAESSRNVYVSGLTAGKTYIFMVTGLVVMGNDGELVNISAGLPKLTFKVKDPNAPQAISMNDMSFVVADGEQIDSDGDFKISFNYAVAVNDASAVNYPFATVEYEVTDESGVKVAGTVAQFDCGSTSKNIYISNLENNKTYTIKATKIEIQDFMTMDMLCELSSNLPSLTFTVGATTGINAATANAAASVKKVVENGKIVIMKNGKKFGLNAVEMK